MAGLKPSQLGFRMPAEWEPHEATWLAWPHERTDWPGKFAPIPWVYGDIVRRLTHAEKVRILAEDAVTRVASAPVVVTRVFAMRAPQIPVIQGRAQQEAEPRNEDPGPHEVWGTEGP